jgi:uncharacterized damage-inducible protein DinB
MDAEYFRFLFDYTYWARDRILAVADGLTAEEFGRPNGFSNYGSIGAILAHCLDAEVSWRCRFEGEADEGVINPEDVPTVEALTQRWREEEAKMRAYLDRLTDGQVAGELVWRTSGGKRRGPLWVSLTHVVNHSTQHRSEAAEALTLVGRSPGDLDFGLFYRERVAGRR